MKKEEKKKRISGREGGGEGEKEEKAQVKKRKISGLPPASDENLVHGAGVELIQQGGGSFLTRLSLILIRVQIF